MAIFITEITFQFHSLRARFEQMQNDAEPKLPPTRIKVNRFVVSNTCLVFSHKIPTPRFELLI